LALAFDDVVRGGWKVASVVLKLSAALHFEEGFALLVAPGDLRHLLGARARVDAQEKALIMRRDRAQGDGLMVIR
jgi:hypothetical protein